MTERQACILKDIGEIPSTDAHALTLLCKARECAAIYLLVVRRRRGCDGMGELAMLKEEFMDAVNVLIKHCKGQERLSGNIEGELESVAEELTKETS